MMMSLVTLLGVFFLLQISLAHEEPGVAYIRWGRNDCPSGNELIYKGFAAGSYYNHNGGTSDFLCLKEDVEYTDGKFQDGNSGVSYLYAVEYRDGIWINDLFDLDDIASDSLLNHDVSCAGCLASGKYSKIMIPGAEECPTGWTTEYVGYMMAPHNSHLHEASALCIDERPTAVEGTEAAANQAFLYMMEIECAGGVPCGPYVDGREIRCAMCTR